MGAAKIVSIWICPPLAFARFGRSKTPLESFHWVDNDYAPRGTAETVVQPDLTFRVGADGSVSAYVPEEIRLRDGNDWRPLCPFFEVHAQWSDGREGPLTALELHDAGIGPDAIAWTVESANRKAYHYTSNEGDLVEARLDLKGDDHDRHALLGVSPQSAKRPIVPKGESIPLGHVQVIRPSEAFPELRLRITPPGGHIYAPTNTPERDLSMLVPAGGSVEDFLAEIRCVLSPEAAWPRWIPRGDDSRTNPGGLYAQTPQAASLGFLDDSNDGRLSITIKSKALPGGALTAWARYTCCPPDFQPDRRPFVSLADGLADALNRDDVLAPTFVEGPNWPQTEAEIADLMQRVRETMEASNLDHQNLRSKLANESGGNTAGYPFEPVPPRPGHPFPLLELGRANHARFLAYDVFKQRLAQRPELFEQWIRKPTNEPAPYDRQMPALMRGSDANPMSLTQRQYDLMAAWLGEVRRKPDGGDVA